MGTASARKLRGRIVTALIGHGADTAADRIRLASLSIDSDGRADTDLVVAAAKDAVFLANGPGDPAALGYVVETVRELVGRKPVWGICLGHQVLCRAVGLETYKLPFGHRGANHPVLNQVTNKVEITSHNHGFAVDPDSLNLNEVELTHVNLNDQTLEGFRHRTEPVFCVQYHPEASPGPHDSHYLFQDFMKLMEEWKK